MPKYQIALDDIFHALSDPTRRAVVQQLTNGPSSVSELAEPFGMSLPSFLQHLGVLEESGLIRSEKIGRVRTCRLDTKALGLAESWLIERRTLLQTRLDSLADFVETKSKKRGTRKNRGQR